MAKNNIPRHIGFIPDGNRRWAVDHGADVEGELRLSDHPMQFHRGGVREEVVLPPA